MAEQEPTAEQLAQIAAENEEDEHSVNYKPPAQKSIQEIQELDKDDESLRKYKEALLGRVAVSADPNVPNVIVTRLTLVCSSAPGPLELDLTGDLESFKKQSFVLKEGVEYRIKISFRVNREIVSGMKYIQHTYRKGVKIDKTDYMVGSYGPRAEEYEFLTPMEEAPKGVPSSARPGPGALLEGQERHQRRYWSEWEDWICGPKLWGSRGRSGHSALGQILGWGRSRRERATKKLQGHQLFTAPARHTPHPGTGQGQMWIRGTGKKARGE
uniref:Rho GDP-dissociation inhibitor 1 n=1 Tax=Prolemur simus TaxID=1328070 RepID=A0A8C9DLK3_PROSS